MTIFKGTVLSILIFILLLTFSISVAAVPIPTNIRVTNYPQLNNEEQVFICPTDSNIIITNWRDFRLGYRQVGVGRSVDGGQTWVDSLIPPSMQYFGFDANQSDPTMTVDAAGNFYMSVLDYDARGLTNGSIIAFYKSTDKGLSWTGPVPNISVIDPNLFEDKQFFTVDRTGGPYNGNVYCSWTRFPNPDRIMLVRSIDGAASFEDTVVIGPVQTSTGCGSSVIDAGQFSIPIVSSNGDVHVFWQGYALDSAATCTGSLVLKHSISTDGGQTFSIEDTLLSVSGYTTANGGINTYSQPVGDADITGGPFDGNIYIAFTNTGVEDTLFRSDVDFIKSTDNASSWSERIQINDYDLSVQSDAFHPWLIVNEEGIICVVFYDNRYDPPGYLLFDLVAAYSFDGGETFSANHRISSVSSSPANLFNKSSQDIPDWVVDENYETPMEVIMSPMAGLIGEYIGISAWHDKLTAIWTDSRDGNSEVYNANWYLPILEPRLHLPVNYDTLMATTRFEWATSWKNNRDQYRWELSTDPSFSTIEVQAVIDTNFYDLPALPETGTFYWRVKTFDNVTADSSDYSAVRSLFVYNSCCIGTRGNVDGDPLDELNISDLLYFVDFAFLNPPGDAPPCPEEADVNSSGTLDVADILYLVDYMFLAPPGPDPDPCF